MVLFPFALVETVCRVLIYSIELDKTGALYAILSHYVNRAIFGGLILDGYIFVMTYTILLFYCFNKWLNKPRLNRSSAQIQCLQGKIGVSVMKEQENSDKKKKKADFQKRERIVLWIFLFVYVILFLLTILSITLNILKCLKMS
jgi:hypothetical protein